MKKRNKFRKIYKGVKIPNWALCYLVNSDASGLTEEDRKIVDEWVEKMREGGRIDVCCPREGEEAYFCSCPAFGLACDVEDCDVVVDKSPAYGKCRFRCCGQSRFEPVRWQALDGLSWWGLLDHKTNKMIHVRRKLRRELVVDLWQDFIHGRLEYEPDDDRIDVERLKGYKSLKELMCGLEEDK